MHELAHVLGFGTSDSFEALTFGSDFIGASTGSVALSADLGHWADGTLSTVNGASQETAMSPAIDNGQRKYFTALDFAAMQDIGWQVTCRTGSRYLGDAVGRTGTGRVRRTPANGLSVGCSQ